MPSSGQELEIAIITTTIIVFLLVALITFLIIIVQVRKKKAKVQLEKEILNAQIEIQEQTLKTISQEIHDNIGQVLSLAKLNLNTLPTDIEEDINNKVNDTKILVGKAISDLRNLSRSMHGERISEVGLKDAIDTELKLLQNTGQYNTNLEVMGDPFSLDPKKEIVLFRMVQESLNNCIKHAKAKNIFVQLSNQEDKYIVVISDDGIGFDEVALQSKQKGIGLRNMQNRASLINGLFSIKSTPENGTTIEIILIK
jgi:two-component system NarL family sensor kinase